MSCSSEAAVLKLSILIFNMIIILKKYKNQDTKRVTEVMEGQTSTNEMPVIMCLIERTSERL